MKKNINHYKNSSISVTPENIHIHISMLFNKAAVLLVKSQDEYENKDFMAYSETIQKAIKILVGLIGILDPNDAEAIQANPSGAQLQTNPWNNYFSAVFKTINDITLKADKSKLHILVKSLKDVAKLWQQAGKVQSNNASLQTPSPQSAEFTLSC